jgi:tRNA 2-thiouridine synthesizing protein A|tara:strand:+ start:312 stop:542 length:231 start_codon:yes stop_codon:yes gene_type:complete
MTYDADLDALGLLCPLPVLKARKRLLALKQGEVLKMHTDDPAALIDVPHFCAESGNELLETRQSEQGQLFFIKKTG